jgi:cell division septal protein FtsQ
MAARKTTRRKTRTTATKRRTPARRASRKKSSSGFVNFFVPLFFIGCILFCLGFLLFMGYQTATASAFFEFEKADLHGIKNVPKDEIKKIVKSHTLQDGVWNADIDAIKTEIEKFKYAKEVSVSRVLPDTVRVIVKERIPVAIVRLDGNDYWVDEDGLVLQRVSARDELPPFTMFGWSEKNTEQSLNDNKKRVALYLQLMDKWKSFDLVKRVKIVDLSDLKDVHAIIEKEGKSVEIRLGEKDFGKRLQKGIEEISGLDKCIDYVISSGEKTFYKECD